MTVFNKHLEKQKNVTFHFQEKPLTEKSEIKYIGIYFLAVQHRIFHKHYEVFTKKADNAVGAVLHARSFVGKDISIWDLIRLYFGCIDTYLKNGAELIPDTVDAYRKQLEGVQHKFLQKFLSQ